MENMSCSDLINKAKDFTDTIIIDRLIAHQKVIGDAIIIIGGSVSFGLADEESDIDYGIVIPNHQDFINFGAQINEAIGGRFHKYDELLIDIHLCSLRSFGVSGNKIDEENFWEKLDPTTIFTIQHAIILRDSNNIFGLLKKKVDKTPANIIKRRIIGRWGFLNMWVDFVRQCFKRNDEIGSFTFAGRAVQEIMMICFLLNRKPYPDPKYRYRLFLNLPKLSSSLSGALQEVSCCSDIEVRYEILANIVDRYSKYMRENDIIEAEYINDWLQCFDIKAKALF